MLVFGVSAVLALACTLGQTQDTGSTLLEQRLSPPEVDESYAVYSYLFRGWQREAKRLAIRRSTLHTERTLWCLQPIKGQKRLYRELAARFTRLNETSLRLANRFENYAVLVDEDEAAAIASSLIARRGRDQPDDSFSKFGDIAALASLSPVAFNSDRSHALVYVELTCGALCGAGTVYFLVKKQGEWGLDHAYKGPSPCPVWVA